MSGPTSPAAPGSPYAVLRNRDFLFYAVGRLFAALGQQMLTVAVGWELYERTGSALALGFTGLTQFLPMLLMTLPAGHFADTRSRKGIIMTAQAVMAAGSLGLALISQQQGPVVLVYICLFVSGVARTFLWSASASFLPQLVSREEFPRALNWSSSTFQFAAVTGPAVGGMLIAWRESAICVYIFNACAALVCLGLMTCVRAQHKPAAKEPLSIKTLLGGFHFVFANRIILGMISLDLFAVLFGGADMLLPVYAKDILHIGPRGLGWLRAALPLGSLLSALIIAHRPPLNKAGRALVYAVIVFGLATIGFGLSTSFWLSLAMLFICGMVDTVSIVVRHTSVQLQTPDEMRGRVSSVNNLFIGTSNELGGFESGLAAKLFGSVFSVVSGGIATLVVVGAICWLFPEIPRYGKLCNRRHGRSRIRAGLTLELLLQCGWKIAFLLVAVPPQRYFGLMKCEEITQDVDLPTPPLSDLTARATAFVKAYPECFWSWHPDAAVRTLEDVRLVVQHLRRYGDRRAWRDAQELHRYLSPLC